MKETGFPKDDPSYLLACIPVRIVVNKGTLLVLCPGNMLNKLPGALRYEAQGEVWPVNKSWDKSDIVGPDGQLFTIGSTYHQALAKALTDAGVPVV